MLRSPICLERLKERPESVVASATAFAVGASATKAYLGAEGVPHQVDLRSASIGAALAIVAAIVTENRQRRSDTSTPH